MLLLFLSLAGDTLRVLPTDRPPVFDGRVAAEEYGAPTLEIVRPSGTARLWLRREGPLVYLAALMPDPSFYWGDDIVISLDTQGDRAAGPMHDDFQWYFRRVLDSSVVQRGEAGRWRMPRDDPDWRLGPEREGGGWEVRSVSEAGGWSLEFRLDAGYFQQGGAELAGLSLRLYDDNPHGWVAWPAAAVKHPTEVERRPDLWAPVRLTP